MASAVGVELHPTGIRAAVLEQSGQRFRLVGMREAACDAANPEALTRALTDLRRSLHISGPIVLGIPSASAILSIVHPLVVVPQRAELAVQFELQQSLPFPLSEAAWHYHWLANGQARAGATGAGRAAAPSGAAAVAAMRRPQLEERLTACRRAGLTVNAVSLNPVAVLNACQLKLGASKPAPMTVLVVHGPVAAEWIVSTRGSLQVIPVVADDPQQFWQDVAAVWTGLQAQDPGMAPGVQVVGPPDAVAAAQQALPGQAVQRVDVTSVLGKSAASGGPAEAAVGLALHGLGAAGLPINLLAASQQQAKSQQLRRIAMIVSGCCLAAAFGLGISGMLEVRGRRASVLETLEKREQLYQTLRPDVRAFLQKQARIEQRTAQLERTVEQAPGLTQVFAQVADTLPGDIWLTSADLSKSGLIHGVLEGRAKSFQDVTKFFEQLKTAAGMTTVKPLSTNVTTDPQNSQESISFSVQVQRPLPGELVAEASDTSGASPLRGQAPASGKSGKKP